jgi:hypothetical protein
VVHAPGGSFEIGVGNVDVCFLHLGVLVHDYVCGQAVVYLLCCLNLFALSLSIPCASDQGELMFVRIEVQILSMPFMSAIGR